MSDNHYYVKKINLSHSGVALLELADKSGKPVFNFKPGQYVMISYKNDKGIIEDKHAFSLASSPEQKTHIRLGIRIQGNFTQGIAKLKEGDDVFLSQPFGEFIFNENKHRDLVLFAGGIGITPFISILNYANDKKLDNKLFLAYSNRTFESAMFFDEIKELENRNKNFSALFSITDEKIPARAKNIINERLDKDIIKSFIGNCQNKHFFICGPMPFMNAIKESLINIGAGEKQIEMEEFSMIPDVGAWAKVKNFSYALGLSTALMFAPFYAIYSADKISGEPATTKNQIFKLAAAKQELESDGNPPEQQENSTPVKTATQAISQAPKATTSASITAESELAVANNNTANQNQTTAAPQPTTSASAPAQTQTTQQTIQTTQQNPTPITSASTPAQTIQPAQTTQSQTTAQATTPAPTTSASTTPAPSSVSAPATQSAPTSQQTSSSQPTPTTSASTTPTSTTPASSQQTSPSQTTASTTQPAPTTSASGTVVSATPSSTPSQITPPQTSSPTQATKERDKHDDDDEEDDD